MTGGNVLDTNLAVCAGGRGLVRDLYSAAADRAIGVVLQGKLRTGQTLVVLGIELGKLQRAQISLYLRNGEFDGLLVGKLVVVSDPVSQTGGTVGFIVLLGYKSGLLILQTNTVGQTVLIISGTVALGGGKSGIFQIPADGIVGKACGVLAVLCRFSGELIGGVGDGTVLGVEIEELDDLGDAVVHGILDDPGSHNFVLRKRLDLGKDAIVNILQILYAGALVIVAGADLVLQPALEVTGLLASNEVTAIFVAVDHRKRLVGSGFIRILEICNALTFHVHSDGKDSGRLFDLGGHGLSPFSGLVAVAGSVGDGLTGLLVVEVAVRAGGLLQVFVRGVGVAHIRVVTGITRLDIGGGESVAEEDDILVVDLGRIQHILSHLQTGFHIGEAVMGGAVVCLIDDRAGIVLHLFDQLVCLICTGAAGHIENLVAVGVKSHKAQLAVGGSAGGIGRKRLNEGLCGGHSSSIAAGGRIAELLGHGIGNVHNQNHGNVLLLVDLIYLLGGGHFKGNIKVIFLVGGLDRLADGYAVAVQTTGGIGAAGLDNLNAVVRGRCLEGHHTCHQTHCQKNCQYSLCLVNHVPFSFQIQNREIGIDGGWAGIASPP